MFLAYKILRVSLRASGSGQSVVQLSYFSSEQQRRGQRCSKNRSSSVRGGKKGRALTIEFVGGEGGHAGRAQDGGTSSVQLPAREEESIILDWLVKFRLAAPGHTAECDRGAAPTA